MFDNLNTWAQMGSFRPNFIDQSMAGSFVFRHIRSPWDQSIAVHGGGALKIAAKEVSLIGGVAGDCFICFKRHGVHVQPGELVKLYSSYEMQRYPAGYFTEWHLPISYFFGGPWEVFNGPNKIVIVAARV